MATKKKVGKNSANAEARCFRSKEELVAWVRTNRMKSRGGVGRPSKKRTEKIHWDKYRGYQTTFIFDAEQYVRVSQIAAEEDISIQEMVFRLLAEGIIRYYSGELDMSFPEAEEEQ